MNFSLIKRAVFKLLLVTVFFTYMTSFAALASGGLSIEQLDDDSVVISGNSGASLKRNTAALYIENANKETVYADSVSVNNNGTFEFLWLPKVADDYNIYVTVGAVSYTESIWYSSVNEYNRLMSLIKTGTSEDMQTVFSSESALKTLGIDKNILDGQSAKEVCDALYNIREAKALGEAVLDYTDEAKTIAEFVKTPNTDTFSDFCDAMKEIGMEIGDREFFVNITNADISSQTIENFAKKLYNNFKEADAFFTETMILSAVYKCVLWTELDEYLLKLNYSVYDNSNYKNSAAQAVAGILYEDKTTLQEALLKAINAAVNPRPVNPPSYGGGGGGGGGGSKSPAALNTVAGTVATDVTQAPQSEEKIVFNDVTESHWVFEAVNYLRWNSIILGDDYNCFYPDSSITRAEMCAMLTRAYGIADGECSFADVPSDSWYYAPVAAAFSAGLVAGDGENFRPDEKITRQDMAVLVYRFALNAGKTFEKSQMNFADENDISDYAVDAVSAMSASGIINGMENNCFAPMATAARAQAAKLIYEAIR